MTPWRDGYIAYKSADGRPVRNPYGDDLPGLQEAWRRGWEDAADEEGEPE